MKYLLLVGRHSTGIILFPDGKTVFHHHENNDVRYPYIVASDFEEAEKKANEIVTNDLSLGVSIYNENEEWIKNISGDYVTLSVKKDKWWKFW